MAGKREPVFVGIFVLAAAAVLVAMVFAISGALGRSTKTFHAYFPFAGGIEPGATVRYAGGPKVGRVEKLNIDPQNPRQIDIVFAVQSDLPVKIDSHAKIMSMSPLGDNHLEVLPGGAKSALAATGALLPSDAYVDFNALTSELNDLAPDAQKLVQTLNARANDLKETLDRVNDVLSATNRANLSATLADTHNLIKDSGPELKSTIHNLNVASEKFQPLIQDLHKTTEEANKALDHLDTLVTDNRDELHQTLLEAHKSLSTLTKITNQLEQTLDVNTENIDELLDNFRRVSENLKEFTNTIKKRPYTLIRASNPPEHKAGEKQ
jgi:phospholipid/cholesterol/gamma-HCH transport system substrate-binding protein